MNGYTNDDQKVLWEMDGSGGLRPVVPDHTHKKEEEQFDRVKFTEGRARDNMGRFVSDEPEEDNYWDEPFRIVWKPKRNGPSHVLVRKQELHHWQKILFIWGGLMTLAIWIF